MKRLMAIALVCVTMAAMLSGCGGTKALQQEVRTTKQAEANQASIKAHALSRSSLNIPLHERAYLILPGHLYIEGMKGDILTLPAGNHSFKYRARDIAVRGGGGDVAVPVGGGFSVGMSVSPTVHTENSIAGEGAIEAGRYYKAESDATRTGGVLQSVSIVELTGEELEQARGRVAEWLALYSPAVIGGLTWAGTNVGEAGRFVDTPEDYGNYYTFDEAQSACPEGWRLPTTEEFASLIAAGQERTHIAGVSGRMFGSGDNRVFFPGEGGTAHIGGVYNPNNAGFYWSSTPRKRTAYGLNFNSLINHIFNQAGMGMNRSTAMSVRCVKE